MIQRIQTLYLLLATASMSLTLFMPLARFTDGAAELTMNAFAILDSEGAAVQSTIYMGILLSLATLLPFVTIFMFRNRVAQVTMCVSELTLIAGALIVEGIYCRLCWRTVSECDFGELSLCVWVAMPVLASIFVLLAARATAKDEKLVRSLDRIR